MLNKVGIVLVLGCLMAWTSGAAERGERIGPYTYIYISDWSKLRHQAEQGDPEALLRIGNLYYQPPEVSGVGQSFKKAFFAFYEAALRNHATAQHNVGAMYLNGDYIAHDLVEAYAWMLVSAKNHDAAGKRKVKEFQNALSAQGHEKARSRADEISQMISEAKRRREFRPERYGIR